MAVYLVTWDLNKEKPNYSAARIIFIKHLERYTQTKDPGLDSVRFVSTTWSVEQVAADLRKKMDENDTLVVTELVAGDYNGYLSEKVWKWIDARVES
jgi:hypothetical protein